MRVAVVATAVCLSAVGISVAADADAAIRKSTNIPAQGLGPALQTLAKERDFQVVYLSDVVDSLRTAGASGEFTPAEAVQQLLRGTELTYRYLDDRTIMVLPLSRSSGEAAKGAAPVTRSSPAKKGFFERLRLTQADAASSGAAGSGAAPERKADTAPARSVVELEEVIVTGSHLRSAEVNASPVIVFERAQIERLGITTTGEVLKALPQNQGGTRTGPFLTYGASRFANLRGLGEGTTLVLIDGQRPGPSAASLASGVARPSQFNLDVIPIAAIERIEVLLDGASAIYGADAVGGVINVILRKDFRGTELAGRYLAVDSGDFSEKNYSAVFGGELAGASLLFGTEYYDRGELRGGERPYTALDKRRFGGTNFSSAATMAPIPANISAMPGSGNLPGLSSPVAAAPGGAPRTLTAADFAAGQSNPLVDFVSIATLVTPQERTSAFGRVELPLGDAWAMTGSGSYSKGRNESFSPSWYNNLTFGAGNPYNPFGVDTRVSFYLLDVPTVSTNDTEDYGGNLGVKGSIADWQVHANVHSNESLFDQLSASVSAARLQQALLATSTTTALNPLFGGAGTSAAVLSSLRETNLEAHTKVQNRGISTGATGTIFDLPAGPVGVALGAEAVEEKFRITMFNAFGVTPISGTDAERDVRAAYVELGVPLARSLKLSLAARYEDYSDFGDTTNPKIGVSWTALPGLTVRGTWGTAFQAPSLAQIATPALGTPGFFYAPLFDPVTNQTYALSGALFQVGNRDLTPQKADTFTLGLSYEGQLAQGTWKASADAYRVDFKDRIFVTNSIPQLIALESVFPSVLRRDPATGRITDIYSFPVNLSTVDTTGVDVSLGYSLPWLGGTFDATVGGTFVTQYRLKLTPFTPEVDRRSYIGFSNQFKGNLQLQYTRLGWQAGATIYYADSYRSDLQPNNDIDALTTVDVQVSYTCCTAWLRPLKDLKLTLGAINVFDEAPPFYNFTSLGFDPGEGDPLQRRFYLKLTTSF